MNQKLIEQYGFVKHKAIAHGKARAAWIATFKNGDNEVQCIIDASLSGNDGLVHKEVRNAKWSIGL